jgi:hypothetical protein
MRSVIELFILLTLLGTVARAQEATDTTALPETEWATKNYTQEDKIYNRSVWTFVDNPALAGFDRKLAVAYRYRMKNLKLGVPNKDGNLVLGFQQHEAFVDLPFGGPKQNWGMGLYYTYEKELQHTYHRVQMARSLRIRLVQEHYLILGFSVGVSFSKLEDWERFTFGDMINPRTGFVYETQEIKPSPSRVVPYYGFGFRYHWKRLSFDYVFRFDPDNGLALSGAPVPLMNNKLKAAYHIYAGESITISPELVFSATSTLSRKQTGPNSSAPQIGSSFYLFSGYVTITYEDMVFGQLGIMDNNKLIFRLGYQLKDMLVIQFGLSSYLDKKMDKIAGIALVEGGIRYQIKAWNR